MYSLVEEAMLELDTSEAIEEVIRDICTTQCNSRMSWRRACHNIAGVGVTPFGHERRGGPVCKDRYIIHPPRVKRCTGLQVFRSSFEVRSLYRLKPVNLLWSDTAPLVTRFWHAVHAKHDVECPG